MTAPPSPSVPPLDPAVPQPRDPATTQRPGEDWLVPVSVVDGVVLVVWSLVGQVFAFGVLAVALAAAGLDVTELEAPAFGAALVVVQSIVLAASLAWLAGRGRLSSRLLGSVPTRPVHVAHGLLGGLLAFGASSSIILLGDALVGPLDEPGQSLLEAEMLSGTAFVFTVVVAAVMAPLLEELTFRGVLFQAVGRRIGWQRGVVLTALVFAVVHLEVVLPLGVGTVVFGTALFVVGAIFALVLHRSRALVAAIVAHATFNGIQLALAASSAA